MKTKVKRSAFPSTAAGSVSCALAIIAEQISAIVYESNEDEGAAEWEGHLRDVMDSLLKQTMTVQDAADSLGLNLSGEEEPTHEHISKYTPGPWKFEDRTVFEDDRGQRVNRIIAECGQSTTTEMDIANARLISAAPEMLSTLKYALAHIELLNVKGVQTIVNDIRSTLAKAEFSEEIKRPEKTVSKDGLG